jgi:LPS O-antigen subunit length determinant protein (WzzB/FepE family)
MEQSKQQVQYYQEDAIDLRVLAYSLFERKFLILGLTAFITVLAYLYSTTIVTSYQANSSFTSPSESEVNKINKLIYTNTNKKMIYSNFLALLASRELQKDVVVENDFLTQFNKDNNPIEDIDSFINGLISSVRIIRPKINIKEVGLYLIEKPYSIEMNGTNPNAISNYLDALVERADSKNITEIVKLNQQKINIRLDQILIERAMLLENSKQQRLNQIDRIMEEDGQKLREINDKIEALKNKAKQDRLNQIDRIMEEDGQKLREINDKIDRTRFEAKEMRLNQIEILTVSAKLAKSLGIIENNFKTINNDESNFDLTIAISENKQLPDWYLYGEKALLQRIKLLGSRTSDDPFIPGLVALKNKINEIQNNNLLKTLEARQDDSPFIPELVTLKNQINEIQNNNLLKTLEARQDDSPFIPELVALNLEKDRLESANDNLLGLKSINIVHSARIITNSRNKNVIVLLAFIGSFIISIFLALIMNALKPDESNPT